MRDRTADIPDALKQRIYEIVRQVPSGRVNSYGDIATMIGGGINAWTVGQALNQVPKAGGEDVPWQRIVNAQGGISTRGLLQRQLLEAESIVFDERERIDMRRFRWAGPSADWAAEHGFQVLPPPAEPEGEQLALF